MPSRIDRFRQYMAALDVSAPPDDAIAAGHYVAPPGKSVADELAARLELRPASSHIVLGGVGTGKSTQLLQARRRLDKLEDTAAIYVDCGKDLETLSFLGEIADALFILGCSLSEEKYGRYFGFMDEDRETLGCRGFDGWSDEEILELIGRIHRELLGLARDVGLARHIIVMLDGLDRMTSTERFAKLVTEDILAIHRLGMGVVVTGPLHAMYGTARTVLDRVDRFYYVPAFDVTDQAEGVGFLTDVLRARLPRDVCSDQACRRLAELSGGVLRDLVALSQSALEEAYVHGSDTIELAHVEDAADVFGRKHLLGLNADELAVLQRVRKSGTFVPTTDRDLALLHTRRVLEYGNGRARHAVHPTIDPLLAQLDES